MFMILSPFTKKGILKGDINKILIWISHKLLWYQNMEMDFNCLCHTPCHWSAIVKFIRNATALQISTIILSASSGFFIFIWTSAGLKWSNHKSKYLFILRVAASSRNKKHIQVSVIYILCVSNFKILSLLVNKIH